jgi:hypothetical protein
MSLIGSSEPSSNLSDQGISRDNLMEEKAAPTVHKKEEVARCYHIYRKPYAYGEEAKAFEDILTNGLYSYVFVNRVGLPFTSQFRQMLIGYYTSWGAGSPEEAVSALEREQDTFAASEDFFYFIFIKLLHRFYYRDPLDGRRFIYRTKEDCASLIAHENRMLLRHSALLYVFLSDGSIKNLQSKEAINEQLSILIHEKSNEHYILDISNDQVLFLGSEKDFEESLCDAEAFDTKNAMLHRFGFALDPFDPAYKKEIDQLFASVFRIVGKPNPELFLENLHHYLKMHTTLRTREGLLIPQHFSDVLTLIKEYRLGSDSHSETKDRLLILHALLRQHVLHGTNFGEIPDAIIPEKGRVEDLATLPFDEFIDVLYSVDGSFLVRIEGKYYPLATFVEMLKNAPPKAAASLAKQFNDGCLADFATSYHLKLSKEELLEEISKN